MRTLFVVDRAADWPDLPGEVVEATRYLAGGADGPARVINLCACERAECPGYYVSLLAEARGHAPFPPVRVLADRLRPARLPRCGPARAGSPSLAILHTADEAMPPSNARALQALARAGAALGLRVETIDRNGLARLAGFDALFIRDTTALGHYTYDFARRAQALGLVVIDDPDSIVQCGNKVFLHELLARHGVPAPRTMLVDRERVGAVARTLGLPCILKQPDGAFSLGVRKVASEPELRAHAAQLLERSALIVAQEYVPTEFDWRIGVLDRRPLFAAKYFMAPGHWQVHKHDPGRHVEGRTVAVPLEAAPAQVVELAVRAANLVGDGLYGVDLKEANGRVCVLEVNDNPNLDAGNEDGAAGDAVYRAVMTTFLRRIRARERAGR